MDSRLGLSILRIRLGAALQKHRLQRGLTQAQLAEFAGGRADHMARHDRGGCLTKRASLYVVREVRDNRAIHLEVDFDGGPAQLRMSGGAGVWRRKTAQARNIAGQFDNASVVNVVQHRFRH